tara:strand:+ start:123 stop:848 length:726 start_codon:yes stop_codon:yes gene_type:complete
MATINATLTLSSGDLLTSNLAFSAASTLSKAGNSTGLEQTSGLSRTNFLSTDPASRSKIIYRADDAATGGANKIYLKNLSTTAAEFFKVYIDQEEMGRLYAGDFAFFPWSATQGTLETFIVTATGTLAAGESWAFDGITTTATSTDKAVFAAAVDAQNYPNWTTSISGVIVTFTARQAGTNGVVTAGTDDAIDGDTLVESGDGNFTMPITAAAVGTRSEADIVVLPSVATTMDLEHMLFKQ